MSREKILGHKQKNSSLLQLMEWSSKVSQNAQMAAEMDLIKDVNETFFEAAYELLQQLSPHEHFLANRMKLYLDLLGRMHTHYVAEVEASKALREKIQTADEKLELALKTTATSDAVMEHLRESLAEAWRTADAVHLREVRIHDQLVNIVQQDENQKKPIERRGDIQSKELRLRSIVYRERDRLAAELLEYQKRLELNREYSQSLENIIATNEESTKKVQEHARLVESEKRKAERMHNIMRVNLEEKIVHLQKDIDDANVKLESLKGIEKELKLTEFSNQKRKYLNDRLTFDNFNMTKMIQRLQEEKNTLLTHNKHLEDTAERIEHERTDLESINQSILRNAKKETQEKILFERRFQLVAKKNTELNDQVTTLQNQLALSKKNLTISQKTLDEVNGQKDEMRISRDKARIEVGQSRDMVAGLHHDIAVQRSQIHSVQLDLSRANRSLEERDNKLQKIIRERTELQQDNHGLSKKIESLEDNMVMKTERIVELQISLNEKQQDYQNVKKEKETVHSEKMMLIKNMEICVLDRQNLQSINTKLSHQINQLIMEQSTNEKTISVLRNQIEQQKSAVKQKENEIHLKERLLHSTRNDLREMKIRFEQSMHTIDEDERRFKSISTTLEEAKKEKSLVGLQMVRRNDELLLLRKKAAVMQFAIDRGTSQYNQRIEDIRLLKLEITNLSMSRDCLRRAVDNTANLRQEIIRLERQLNQERLRVTAFVEGTARPCRIHRWRVLLGKDPHRYELLRKIQILLKRNLRLNVEKTNMEQRLQDFERMHNTLKQQMQHMPDANILQTLSAQQRINRKQQRQLRVLAAELSITEIDLKTRDCLIEGYQQAMKEEHENKRRHFEEKNKCQCQEPQRVISRGWVDVQQDQCAKAVFHSSSSITAPTEKKPSYIRVK